MLEKRVLQIAVLIASIVPIGAGLAGIIIGPWTFGARSYSVDLISHVGYLSGLLLAIGLIFAISVPNVEKHKDRFLILGVIVFIGGLARLYEGLLTGFGTMPHQLALVMELIITPLIVLWQRRVARLSGR
ncbi:DUF4345 domain-containing protein [Ahrensia kielensis]|uniref:DUF4345 domain-containing protein n=1 Tax=Ahrensia kielensis TaxID=76980 RepID=UPI0003789F01|nr:DUF4345 domain-containing protein [Ahrensia kielensis]